MTMTATAPAPPRPAPPAPPRLAGARSRRVPWVALGVVLVLGGALAVGLLVQSAGRRTAVVVAAGDLAPGHVVTPADLRVVEVALDGPVATVPATRRAELVGQTARSRVPAGSLVSSAQFARGPGLAPGRVVVGALLGPGGLPVPNLRVGDRVAMFQGGGAERSVGPAPALGVAEVFLVGPGPQQGTQFVSLAVEEALAARVTDAVAAQRLRLVLLPAAGGTGR